MSFLANLQSSTSRIPKSFLEKTSIEDLVIELDKLDWNMVSNPHLFNLKALLIPTSKTLVGIELVDSINSGDLELEDAPHSYIANGVPVHNTCNIPHDYPLQSFKDLYLGVYNTGIIKGFTTYRAGTMTSVLSAAKEQVDDEEEIILDEIKLPDSLPATLKTIRAEGKKWYLTVILNEQQTRPVALFAQTNHHEKNTVASNAVDHLLALAISKNIPEKYIREVQDKIAGDNNTTKICRLISLCLRHGVLIRNLVTALNGVDCIVGSFVFHVRKYLATFIKDGEVVVGVTCAECGSSKVIYQEGCQRCVECGSSKCS